MSDEAELIDIIISETGVDYFPAFVSEQTRMYHKYKDRGGLLSCVTFVSIWKHLATTGKLKCSTKTRT